ncbi:MAG TPA: thioredoxin domain-containing protein, partial [Pyrinomonadaceae bacterium]|nr:thioredoxin domain-containing protein [Pyrinomonadaceae bacterium]
LGAALGSAWYLTRPIPALTPAVNSASSGLQGATAQPVANKGVPGAEPAHTLGPATAPAHVEEFGDFQCPPCGIFHPILEQMEEEFGDKLRVTFRQFPLVPAHRHALIAASATEAAGLQGKFWQMHKLIFDHQKDWKDSFDSRPIFEGYAKEIGLDIEKYKRDIESDAVAQRVFLDGKRGYSLGVKGTPTVFLNDREVPFETLIQADKLRVVIQKEIESARK